MIGNTAKRICWVLGGCLILCAVIFHQAFLTFLANWSLQAYSVAKLGQPLQYEKIFWNGHQLVIVQPQFEHESLFTAEKLILAFRFQFWKRQLDVEIDIEEPHWHFETPLVSQWEKLAELFIQEEKWLKIYPHFHMKRGQLSWIGSSSYQGQLNFDLDVNHQEGGSIKLYFGSSEIDRSDRQTNLLLLKALKADSGIEVNCYCEKINCFSLMNFAQFLGLDLSSWCVNSGSLHGELKAIFSGKQRPYLEGDLIVENLNFIFKTSEGESPLQSEITALQGQIGKARLHLEKNQITYEFNHPFPTTIGKFDILDSASLHYDSPLQKWSIDQIKGRIWLDEVETAWMDLWAEGGNLPYPLHWNLQGMANLNAQHSLNLNMTLSCSTWDQANGKIHLALDTLRGERKHIKISCEKLSYLECQFLQNLIATRWPTFSEVVLQDGEFNAFIEADILDQGIGELYVKHFEAFHLRSKLKPWNMTCDFGEVRGYGKVQLGHEDFWQSVNAGLHLEDGQIEFEDLIPSLPMTDIQAHLLIQQGHVEHSLVTLQVAGLKGKMDVEWGGHKQLLTFKLDGIVQDLADLYPHILQEGLWKHFYHNRLLVLANLKRQNQQIELDGTLHVQWADTHQMDLIHFGCELKNIREDNRSKCVPVGWFHAQKLPLGKFLSPFIFPNDILQMSGDAELKGSFDDQFLVIKYDANDLKIENENFHIEIPVLRSPVPGQLIGSHQIDLRTYHYEGTLPLQSASYFEKKSGLLFQDIQGFVKFSNHFIHILPIEAYCEGVYFAGELELDYSHPTPGIFDIKIQCPNLSGKVSQIQHLLAHLDQPSLLYKIPLEGEVTGKGKGMQLKFAFNPDDYHLQADIQGTMTEGALSFEGADMALRGMYMDVDYHHQNQLLEFSDIQGTLLVGKPRRVEEYLFMGHHIHFHPLDQLNLDLDIAIKDGEHELLRFVGYTQDELEGMKSVHLNKNLSHLSCIYPGVWLCQLKDWSNLEQFDFLANFDLGIFLQDLKRFRQTGLGLSPTIIDKISQFLPIEGQASLALRYHPDQSYSYDLKGSLKQENSCEHFGVLRGRKQDKKWIIDQLQWDEWNAYAELHQLENNWRIPFLGLKFGDTLLLGLEGDWQQEQALLQAKLKFCQVDLSKLDRFEALQAFVKKWWPKGILNATGEIEWNLFASNLLEGCKVSLLSKVDNFSLRDYPFPISNTFQTRIQPYHSFCLENIQIELSPQKRQSYIDLKQFEYQWTQTSISSLEMVFQIPHHQLKMMSENLHYHFPDILNETVKDLIGTAKQQGELKGKLMVGNCSPHSGLLQLELEDGLYTFKKREYDLKQFQLQVIGEELKFSGFSRQERYPFQMIGQAKWPTCQKGQITLMGSDISHPLIIKWENQLSSGWNICSLQGEFGGCSFLLKEDVESEQTGEWKALQGRVAIDFNRLSSLLPLDVAETIQKLKLGLPYSFSGRFWLNPDLGETFLEILSFKGKLTGEEVILKGYQMRCLQTDLQYVPGRLDVQNFTIQDPAGCLKATDILIMLDKNREKWTFFVPRLTAKNCRPNLLRDVKTHIQGNPKFRSLVLKRVEFQDLRGDLKDVATWQAQGSLHFLNPSRKNPFHPILAIPAEIILRLGLDPHVLNPVTGIIDFRLEKERFYLKRFKDVYSEGRGSKFYLAQNMNPSWMDLDGNLSVNIRMKQYNLIFKIAELFTVSIQGNLKKPRYSLQKQIKTPRQASKQDL